MKIHSLFRYPIKGLSAEALERMELIPERGCLGDRAFAIAHANSKFDPSQPTWLHRRNFLTIAHQPTLARLSAHFDEASASLVLKQDKVCLYSGGFSAGPVRADLAHALDSALGHSDLAPYQVARLPTGPLSDSPDPVISLLNFRSLDELARKSGIPAEELHSRFRANVWFSDAPAWEEQSWLGKTFQLGSATVRATEKITRCAAIEVSTKNGQRDSRLLNTLVELTGDPCFGLYCEIIKAGTVSLSDTLHEIPA